MRSKIYYNNRERLRFLQVGRPLTKPLQEGISGYCGCYREAGFLSRNLIEVTITGIYNKSIIRFPYYGNLTRTQEDAPKPDCTGMQQGVQNGRLSEGFLA